MIKEFKSQPSGFGQMTFTAQTDPELGEFERTFPRQIPPGHTLVAEWTGERKFVVKVVPAADDKAAPAPADGFDGLSDADLQTKAAENGVVYSAKKFDRAKAISDLRTKTQKAGA